MEYCSRCRKVVNTIKQLNGCSIDLSDPQTGKEEVKFTIHCEECNCFIRQEKVLSVSSTEYK